VSSHTTLSSGQRVWAVTSSLKVTAVAGVVEPPVAKAGPRARNRPRIRNSLRMVISQDTLLSQEYPDFRCRDPVQGFGKTRGLASGGDHRRSCPCPPARK